MSDNSITNERTKIIVIANRKGGVGKTTLTHNLAYSFALQKKKVLLIDLDSQSNLGTLCNIEAIDLNAWKNFETITINPYMDLLPATKRFPMLEKEIDMEFDRNIYLKNLLSSHFKSYNYVIIDTSPSLSILNINAFALANLVFLIVNPDKLSLNGMIETIEIIETVKKINPALFYKIVLNEYNKTTTFSEEVMAALRNHEQYSGIEIPQREYLKKAGAKFRAAIDNDAIGLPINAMTGVI
jgi:chromosome partitioning protein